MRLFNPVFVTISIILNALGINIVEITNADVIRCLKYGDMFSDGGRMIGYCVYTMLGSVVDFVEMTFMQIAKIDFSSIVDLSAYQDFLDIVTWGILTLAVLLAVAVSFFKTNGSTEYVKWTVFVILAIALFGTFNTYINDAKDAAMEGVAQVFADGDGDGQERTLSERIFYDNSYDMLASISANNLVKINQRIPLYGMKINEKMSEDDIDGKITYDVDGNATVQELYDGVLNTGFNEERYYRFYVNFLSCTVILFICGFILILGMVKMAYIGINWFFTVVYGGLIMATDVSKMDKVKLVYTTVLQSVVSMVIVYAGIQIFELMISSIMVMDINWLAGAILLFVSGLVTILGSSIVNKGLGLDDGTSFMLRSAMITSMFGRGMKKMSRGAKKISNAGKQRKPPKGTDTDGSSDDIYTGKGGDGGVLTPVDTGNQIGGANPASLDNKVDTDKLFGGEGIMPGFAQPDITDQWAMNQIQQNDKKKERYEEGQKLQNEIEERINAQNRMQTEQTDTEGNKEYANTERKQAKTSSAKSSASRKINPLTSDDLKKYDVPFKPSEYGKHKSYQRYMEDFGKGDKSTINPYYKGDNNSSDGYRNDVAEKKLPSWYTDQDSVSKDTANLDKQALKEKMARLSAQANSSEKKSLPAWYYNQDIVPTSNEEVNDDELYAKLRNLGSIGESTKKEEEDINSRYAKESASGYESFLNKKKKTYDEENIEKRMKDFSLKVNSTSLAEDEEGDE